MRAISIRQPFASAILDGPKRVENRPRKMGLHEGRWVWVHTSLGFHFSYPEWTHRVFYEMRQQWSDAPLKVGAYPRGCILGAMLCGPTRPLAEHVASHPEDEGWAFGPYCTRIEAVLKLSTPFSCKGSLGLWSPPLEMTLDAKRLEGIRADALEQLDPEQYNVFARQLVEGWS